MCALHPPTTQSIPYTPTNLCLCSFYLCLPVPSLSLPLHFPCSASQNWFRAASHMVITNKAKAPESNGIKMEVKNGATAGKKRGRKPKERPPEAAAVQTPPSTTPNSTPTLTHASTPTQTPTQTLASTDRGSPTLNRHPNPPATRRGKPKKVTPSE